MKFTALAISSMALVGLLSAQDMQQVPLETFSKMPVFQDSSLQLLDATQLNDGYIVKMVGKGDNGFSWVQAYIPKDLKTVTVGNTISSDGKKGYHAAYTEAGKQRAEAFKRQFVLKDLEQLKKEAALVIGHGDKEVFLVTDPDCPFCRQLDAALEKADDRVKVYVYLKSLEGLRGHTRRSVEFVMSASKEVRAEKLREYFKQGSVVLDGFVASKETIAAATAAIAKADAFMQRFEIGGTPSLRDQYGFKVEPSALLTDQPKKVTMLDYFERADELGLSLKFGERPSRYLLVKASDAGLKFLASLEFKQLKQEGLEVVLQVESQQELQLKRTLFVLGSEDKITALSAIVSGKFKDDKALESMVQEHNEVAAKIMMVLLREQRIGKQDVLLFDGNGHLIKKV